MRNENDPISSAQHPVMKIGAILMKPSFIFVYSSSWWPKPGYFHHFYRCNFWWSKYEPIPPVIPLRPPLYRALIAFFRGSKGSNWLREKNCLKISIGWRVTKQFFVRACFVEMIVPLWYFFVSKNHLNLRWCCFFSHSVMCIVKLWDEVFEAVAMTHLRKKVFDVCLF